ncbi:hypothetical protein [Comamonas serinivorans]|nr:hypothetical protein [Comamonas serinivorans]
MLNNHAGIDTLRVMGQGTHHVPPAVPLASSIGPSHRGRVWAGAQTMAQAP